MSGTFDGFEFGTSAFGTTSSPTPTPTPTPTPAPTPNPGIASSPNPTVITPSGGGSIVDQAGNVYTLTSLGAVYVNGSPVANALPSGGGASQLAYVNSSLYAQSANNSQWYAYNSGIWNGPVASPLTTTSNATPTSTNTSYTPPAVTYYTTSGGITSLTSSVNASTPATAFVAFVTSTQTNFQFIATLDGTSYNITVTWNISRGNGTSNSGWYINIYNNSNALVLCTPLIGSPPNYGINLVGGYFDTILVFRQSTQQFEITSS